MKDCLNEGMYQISDGRKVDASFFEAPNKWKPGNVKGEYGYDGIELDIKVTHWQPLPEPPKSK